MHPIDRYHDNLTNPRPPGTGCHGYIMSTANLGVMAGKDPQEIHNDLRQAIPPGTRRIPDREISDAINKALADRNGGTFNPRPRPEPVVKDGKAALSQIINKGRFSAERELIEASPIRVPDNPAAQQKLFLQTIFRWDDFVFIGDRLQPGNTETIRPACEWVKIGAPGPFVIINPMSGYPAPLKSGDGATYRGDACVKTFRHCLVEFDNIPVEDQVRFWSAIKLPVKALIHTGNKSLHAWLDLSGQSIITPEAWQKTIKIDLYETRLKPLGVDPACSNPARLARLPGVFRQEKNQWQRLLWLSKDGRNVC